MESITKNRQSPQKLAELVERAYGPGLAPEGADWIEEMGHGWFNVAYQLTLTDGRRVLLKIAPPPQVQVLTYEIGAMEIEVTALRMLAERTNVPVPAVDFYDTSCELVDAPYFFEPFIDADVLAVLQEEGLSQAEFTPLWEQAAALNRQLNELTSPTFGHPLHPSEPTWRATFERMMDDILRDGEARDVDMGWSFAQLRATAAEHADCLDTYDGPARFVEWDLWPGNVMVRDGKVVAIIDHERWVWGDPIFEAGFLTLDGLGTDSETFLRGYGRGPLTEDELARRTLYDFYLFCIMVIETVYRAHETPDMYNWARERLDETMARLGHTRG